jgi:DNA processing protein
LSTNTAGQSSNPLRNLGPESDFFPKMQPRPILGLVGVRLDARARPALGRKAAARLSSSEAIFTASLTALEAKRLPAAVAQAIYTRQSLGAASKEMAQVQAVGCHLITWDEPHYPQRLREIYDPPPLSMSAEILNF